MILDTVSSSKDKVNKNSQKKNYKYKDNECSHKMMRDPRLMSLIRICIVILNKREMQLDNPTINRVIVHIE